MNVSEEQKEHLTSLLENDQKIEAVRYIQKTFNLSTDQALSMVERLEEEREKELFGSIQEEHVRIKKSLPRLVGGIFLWVGILLLALTVFFGVREYQFGQRAVSVIGTVTEFVLTQSYDSQQEPITLYAPVVAYQVEGQSYSIQSSTQSSLDAPLVNL
jgi:hypothetical protein